MLVWFVNELLVLVGPYVAIFFYCCCICIHVYV